MRWEIKKEDNVDAEADEERRTQHHGTELYPYRGWPLLQSMQKKKSVDAMFRSFVPPTAFLVAPRRLKANRSS